MRKQRWLVQAPGLAWALQLFRLEGIITNRPPTNTVVLPTLACQHEADRQARRWLVHLAETDHYPALRSSQRVRTLHHLLTQIVEVI